MSNEIPEIPDSADELVARIDAAKAQNKTEKTPEEVGEQIGRISKKLLDRAEKMGPSIFHRGGDNSDHLVLMGNVDMKGKIQGKSLVLKKEAESGNKARQLRVGPGQNVEIRWADAPANSVYGTPSQGLKIETEKKLFKKGETSLTTDMTTHEGFIKNVEANKEDVSRAAGALSDLRGALSEKAIEVEKQKAER